jgi:predicted ArsR family transcriptional regulator
MNDSVPSDRSVLDLLRRRELMTVAEFEAALGVTATAVRQRLGRLLAQGLIQRRLDSAGGGRGRPSHRYELTDAGRRNTGSNFTDLALVLWAEIRAVQDAGVRRGLLQRLAERLADHYAEEIRGESLGDRMRSVAGLLGERQIPFEVREEEGQLPVLNALACPYPQLAEQDRGVCAMERMLFSALVGQGLQLEQCRLDGAPCCTFSVSETVASSSD